MEKQKRRILLIDDDTSLLVTLSDFLRFEGYDVVTADSGEQGLRKLSRMPLPDLIILDMSMPGMGGVGFLKEISNAEGKPKYPVLVLTARANMAEFFANVEVDGFIAKPCDPNDLLMEVGRIIFLRRGLEEEKAVGSTAEKKKVLIAEDDRSINENLVNVFASEGFVVNSVMSGPEVLEKAIVERPDVIVMKLVLANMNGDAVAQLLKEMPNTRSIPIVLYDDSDAQVPSAKFTESGTGIKKFVRSNNGVQLLSAVKSLIG